MPGLRTPGTRMGTRGVNDVNRKGTRPATTHTRTLTHPSTHGGGVAWGENTKNNKIKSKIVILDPSPHATPEQLKGYSSSLVRQVGANSSE